MLGEKHPKIRKGALEKKTEPITRENEGAQKVMSQERNRLRKSLKGEKA